VGAAVTTVLAVLSYIGAVLIGLGVFLFCLGKLLSQPVRLQRQVALTAVSAALMLFLIGGGYVWFRFLSVTSRPTDAVPTLIAPRSGRHEAASQRLAAGRQPGARGLGAHQYPRAAAP
jgi:hypothetical protein